MASASTDESFFGRGYGQHAGHCPTPIGCPSGLGQPMGGRLSYLEKTQWPRDRGIVGRKSCCKRIKYTRKSENRASSNAFVVCKRRGVYSSFFVLFGMSREKPYVWMPTSSGIMTYAQKRFLEKLAPMTSSQKIEIVKNKNKMKNGS